MAKKYSDGLSLSKPIDGIVTKKEFNSKALNRVLKHNTGEGIYLSKYQLIQLGKDLENMVDGPDGIWFLIGETKIGTKNIETVELIPYTKNNQGHVRLYNKGKNIGSFNANLSGYEIDNDADIQLNSTAKLATSDTSTTPPLDTHNSDPTPGGGTSQRTPPPFPE